ncbi:MAG TPA: tetratricopeptide repeat protein, partial [Blastocatellia bacterium]
EATDALHEAVAYDAAGEAAEAVQAFEQAIHLDPSLQRAYFELARLYARLGQDSTRVQVLQRYIQLFPESIKGRLELNEKSR